MDAIKNSLKTVRASFESIPFLKFMVKAGVYVFAAGGLLWLVAGFIPTVTYGFVSLVFLKSLIATCGRLLIVAGLLLAVLKQDELILMISSAAISVGALVVSLIEVIGPRYFASFESWFFFLLFGGLAALVFIFGDKMKEYRAKAKQNAQARAAQQAAAQQTAAQQVQLIECPNCKGPVPINVQFCSNCGAPNPAMQYQQAPPAPQAAPAAPVSPVPPVAPAAPEPPEAPPAAPVADTSAPLEAAPAAAPAPPAAPVAPAAPAVKMCVACGAELNANAAFCGQCGAKQ